MSQLLKRAGLAKRPRPGRPAGRVDTMPRSLKETRRRRPLAHGSTEHQTVNGHREQGQDEKEKGEEEEEGDEEDKEEENGVGEGHRGDDVGKAEGVAVDDRIAALERELEQGGDGTSSSGSDDDISDDDDSIASADISETKSAAVIRERRRIAKLVSPLAAEKIEPLAPHLLPRPGCGIQKAPMKKKRDRPKVGEASAGAVAAAPGPSQGLDSAVKELMANYEARSSERVPFYCRVCKFQGDRCVQASLESYVRDLCSFFRSCLKMAVFNADDN